MPRGWGRERTGRPGRASGLLFAYGRGHGLGCMQIVRSDLSAFWPTPSYHVVDTESPKVIKTVVGAGASWAKSSGLACSAHEVDIVCPELGVEIGAQGADLGSVVDWEAAASAQTVGPGRSGGRFRGLGVADAVGLGLVRRHVGMGRATPQPRLVPTTSAHDLAPMASMGRRSPSAKLRSTR